MKTTRFNGLLFCICMLAFALSVANARPESEIEMLSKDAQKYFVIKEPFFLQSKKGIKYKIFIAHTKDLGDSKNPTIPYRTLFVLDGNAQFPMALNVCTQEFAKKQKGKNAPLLQAPLLIVGIGYEGEKPYDMPSRTRDFLPKLSPKDLSIAPKNIDSANKDSQNPKQSTKNLTQLNSVAESTESKNPKNAEYVRETQWSRGEAEFTSAKTIPINGIVGIDSQTTKQGGRIHKSQQSESVEYEREAEAKRNSLPRDDTINRNEALFETIQNYSGGQEDFYSFLSHELTPFLQKSYAIDSKHFGIFGHSFGGLFVLSALQQKAQIFSHYFSASPSIWIFQTPNPLQIPDSKRVVISVGERENVAILKSYVALQKVKNSDLSFFVIPNVGHGGSIKPSLKRAFELLGEKK